MLIFLLEHIAALHELGSVIAQLCCREDTSERNEK